MIPIFLSELHIVIEIYEHIVLVQSCQNGLTLKKHRDYIKLFTRALFESPDSWFYYEEHSENIPNNERDNSDRHLTWKTSDEPSDYYSPFSFQDRTHYELKWRCRGGIRHGTCCRFHGKICKSEVMLFQLDNLELRENQTVDSTTKIHIYYIFWSCVIFEILGLMVIYSTCINFALFLEKKRKLYK